MANKKEIIQFIKDKIEQKVPKEEIAKELSAKYEDKRYEKILKDFPEPALKEKYKTHNNILITCLIIVTLIKIAAIFFAGKGLNPAIILLAAAIGLIVPAILIKLLLDYRAIGYIFTFALTAISLPNAFTGSSALFASGDIISIGIYIFQLTAVAIIIFLSLFLWTKIYRSDGKTS